MKRIKLLGLLGIIGLLCFSFLKKDQVSNNYYRILSYEINDSVPDEVAVITGSIIAPQNSDPIMHIAFQRHDETGMDFKTAHINRETGKFYFRMPPQKGVFYAQTVLGNEIVLPMKDYENRSWTKINFYSSDSLKPKGPIETIRVIEPTPSFKPVIYLYNDKKIDVSIDLTYKGNLTFTYPKYTEGWNVTVDKNGIQMEGKKYPYLFWEGEMTGLEFNRNAGGKIPATIVNKKNIVKELEASLKGLGLNDKEKTDFITFWGPKMEQYDKVAFQFLRNSDYSKKVASLKVSPKPNVENRIYILYTHVTKENQDQFDEIKVNYEPFVRKGFTLIEWGGSEISSVEIKEQAMMKRKKKGQVCGTMRNNEMPLIRRSNK